MPFSSMARIRVASVYRAGGWVKCWSGLEALQASPPRPPSGRAGRAPCPPSRRPGPPHTRRCSRRTSGCCALARKVCSAGLPSRRTRCRTRRWPSGRPETGSRSAGTGGTARRSGRSSTCSGVRVTSLGRMASWASWAPALVLYCRGCAGRSRPRRSGLSIKLRAAARASSESRRESVRI